MAHFVYIMCAVTSIGCAVLLLRGYRASRARLLFWTALCFIGLAANNVLLVVDLMVIESIDFGIARSVSALLAMSVLLYGLVWESQ